MKTVSTPTSLVGVTVSECDIEHLKNQTTVELRECSSAITETQLKLEKLCKIEALMECASRNSLRVQSNF